MCDVDLSNWVYSKKGIIGQNPPYQSSFVDKKVLFNHFKKGIYIRWDSDFDQSKNPNYYHVIKDGDSSLESLPSKTRNMIRRCLKNCDIHIADFQHVTNSEGYKVYLSENRRYEKNGFGNTVKQKEQWEKGMKEASLKGYDIWSVDFEDRVVAYAFCRKQGKHINLVTWKCDYENYKHLYPSYGLVYTMLNYYLSQEGVMYVDDGGRSLTEHSAVQNFLIDKFGFRKAYTNLNAYFKWFLYPLLMLTCPLEKIIKNNSLRSLVRLYKWSR